MNNESLVLTINNSGTNYYTVCMDTDNNAQEQLWEVLPYDSSYDYSGIVIRSKVLYYPNANDVGKQCQQLKRNWHLPRKKIK